MKVNKTIHVPFEIATKPKSGDVMCDYYWLCHPSHGICFYNPIRPVFDRVGAPQANQDENVSNMLIEWLKLDDKSTYKDLGYEVKLLESVYLSSCLSWVRQQDYVK